MKKLILLSILVFYSCTEESELETISNPIDDLAAFLTNEGYSYNISDRVIKLNTTSIKSSEVFVEELKRHLGDRFYDRDENLVEFLNSNRNQINGRTDEYECYATYDRIGGNEDGDLCYILWCWDSEDVTTLEIASMTC